ncbi:MAG: hypothetical protein IPJ07_13890 [Acidobacteria bacterium]|nr:hypothetical protein [Acidobacteriota bacterium]
MNHLTGAGSNQDSLIDSTRIDLLNVHIFESAEDLESALTESIASEIIKIVAEKGHATGIFSSASEFDGLLHKLTLRADIPWTRFICYAVGEYVGMDEDSPRSLRRYLIERLVSRVPIAEFHGLRGEASNLAAVCSNFASLLESRPPDFAVIDLDQAGGLSLIDARNCDFNDPAPVRVIERSDGRALITMTIPTLIKCRTIFASAFAPAFTTAFASAGDPEKTVVESLKQGIRPQYPASILTTHPCAHLFLNSQRTAKGC